MAVASPRYLDLLVKEFPEGYKTSSVPQDKYVEDSLNIGEFIEKLLSRLSVLLFHVEKQINKVLLQGRFLPKKLTQWATESRALKDQVSNLLKKQQNSMGHSVEVKDLVEVGIKMINILKKCPCKDELMYDKPFPLIVSTRKPGLNEPKMSSSSVEHETKVESASCGEVQVVRETTTPGGTENSFAEQKEVESSSSSIEKSKHQEESIPSPTGTEIYHEGASELTMPVTSSGTDETSQGVDIKQETLHPFSQEMQQCYNPVPKNDNYSVVLKDNIIMLELDHQSILIGDNPSSGPLGSSSVSDVINLAEKNLRELPEKPDYPDSLLLFLQRNNRLTHIHSSFFNSMPDLLFLDLSDTRIRILPSSLFSLSKLKVLMLRNCVCLDKLPTEIGKLNQLEVLDLSGTELYEIPDEIGELTLVKHMQLSFYGPDDESEYVHLPSEPIPRCIMSKLKALQELSIIVHPEDDRWTKTAGQIIEDVGRLDMLNYLQIYFPEVEIFEHFVQRSPSWSEQRLRRFKFNVGQNVKRIVSRVPDREESKYDQQGQCLRFVNGDTVSHVIKSVLMRVTAFYLDHHIQIKSLSDFGISNFKALKFCVVAECPKVEVIIDEELSECAFPFLEHLGVYYLWELKQICKKSVPPGSFHALKYLIVNTCPKLRFILRESMLQCLSNLEEFVVEDCASVEKLVEGEKRTVKYDGLMLPRLRELVLKYLPQLVSLGNGLHLSKDKISTHGCPKLILNSQPREQTRVKQRKFLGTLRGWI